MHHVRRTNPRPQCPRPSILRHAPSYLPKPNLSTIATCIVRNRESGAANADLPLSDLDGEETAHKPHLVGSYVAQICTRLRAARWKRSVFKSSSAAHHPM